jgi:hypothetical protein
MNRTSAVSPIRHAWPYRATADGPSYYACHLLRSSSSLGVEFRGVRVRITAKAIWLLGLSVTEVVIGGERLQQRVLDEHGNQRIVINIIVARYRLLLAG